MLMGNAVIILGNSTSFVHIGRQNQHKMKVPCSCFKIKWYRHFLHVNINMLLIVVCLENLSVLIQVVLGLRNLSNSFCSKWNHVIVPESNIRSQSPRLADLGLLSFTAISFSCVRSPHNILILSMLCVHTGKVTKYSVFTTVSIAIAKSACYLNVLLN